MRRAALSLIASAAILHCPASGADAISAKLLFAWPQFIGHAHSHNDYEQEHPLADALEAGLSSVEADLFLDGETIMVAHERGTWRGTFEALYLKPLNQRWEEKTLPTTGPGPFLLWLDLKEPGVALRRNLHRLLDSYPVTRVADRAHARIQIILTGNKEAKEAFVHEYPSALIVRDSNSFADDDVPSSSAWTWYALDWTKLATWNGEGTMPETERARLHALVEKVHGKGRKLRLWKHPATLEFWKEAVAAGVDRLGTDVLPKKAN